MHERVENGNDKLIKVNSVPFDKVYFGMSQYTGKTMKLNRPLFVTPYKGIASIFAVSRNEKIRSIIRGSGYKNLGYDEWGLPKSQLQDYLTELHVQVQGGKDFPEQTFDLSGYIYEIDISQLKDNIYQHPWMNKDKEFLIANIDEVKFSSIRKVNIKTYVKHYDSKPIKESYDSSDYYSIAKELYHKWQNFKYEDIDTFQSPAEFDQHGCGNCWDFVEYGEQFLMQNRIKYHKYYVFTKSSQIMTHSFLVLDDPNGLKIYPEYAFDLIKGIHQVKTNQDVFNAVLNAISQQTNSSEFDYVIFDYTHRHPPYGCSHDVFMNWIANYCKDIKDGKYKTEIKGEFKMEYDGFESIRTLLTCNNFVNNKL